MQRLFFLSLNLTLLYYVRQGCPKGVTGMSQEGWDAMEARQSEDGLYQFSRIASDMRAPHARHSPAVARSISSTDRVACMMHVWSGQWTSPMPQLVRCLPQHNSRSC